MQVLRNMNEKAEKTSFEMMVQIQSDANKTVKILRCSTICEGYSVPGGGTPCGTKCIMYCVGK